MRGKGLERAEELALALAALDEAAGGDASLVSFTVDAASAPAPGASLRAQAQITRATRTLVFLAADVTAGEAAPTLVVSAVYRRSEDEG